MDWLDEAIYQAQIDASWSLVEHLRKTHGRRCSCATCAMAREALRRLLDQHQEEQT
jgi:hypothetical protein